MTRHAVCLFQTSSALRSQNWISQKQKVSKRAGLDWLVCKFLAKQDSGLKWRESSLTCWILFISSKYKRIFLPVSPVAVSPRVLDRCPMVALLPDILNCLLKWNGARQFPNYQGGEINSASLNHLLPEHLSIQEDCEVPGLAFSKWRGTRSHEPLPRSSVTPGGVYNHFFGCYSDCAAPSLMPKHKLSIYFS